MIIGIALIVLGLMIAAIAIFMEEAGIIFAPVSGLIIALGLICVMDSGNIISEQNKLIAMPAQIEVMKQEITTPEEKEIVNNKINWYNEKIVEYHQQLLTNMNKNTREEKVFNLQPIEEIQ